jgi:acetyl esterase/lipase
VVTRRPTRLAYGPDPSQFGELSLPTQPSRGTIVVIHGGFWRAQYGLALGRPLAADLVRRGYTVWTIEYRRVGQAGGRGGGGGWPATLDDVGAAIDHLVQLDIDSNRVVTVGHSAGGHLAVWAAGRPGIADGAAGSSPAVRLRGAVSQAGVLDLVTAANTGVGGTAVPDLLGGLPDQVPARYAIADPSQAIPLDVPVLCVHAKADDDVPYELSVGYVAAATAAGATATLATVPGDHYTLIDPSAPAWDTVVDALPGLLGR